MNYLPPNRQQLFCPVSPVFLVEGGGSTSSSKVEFVNVEKTFFFVRMMFAYFVACCAKLHWGWCFHTTFKALPYCRPLMWHNIFWFCFFGYWWLWFIIHEWYRWFQNHDLSTRFCLHQLFYDENEPHLSYTNIWGRALSAVLRFFWCFWCHFKFWRLKFTFRRSPVIPRINYPGWKKNVLIKTPILSQIKFMLTRLITLPWVNWFFIAVIIISHWRSWWKLWIIKIHPEPLA